MQIIERFWNHVQRCEHGAECVACCWLWTASHGRDGYGQFMLHPASTRTGGKVRRLSTHRFSWMLTQGDIPQGLCVLHNCPGGDNRLCVNPAHLWLGTIMDNTHDAMRKGDFPVGDRNGLRKHPGAAARGDRHSSRTRAEVPSNAAALELAQVQDILYLVSQGMSDTLLGHIYNVDRSTIGLIRRGKTWQRVLANVEGARV